MKIDTELYDICREFIKENKLFDEDSIDDLDRETFGKFVIDICELIGYHDETEDWFDEDSGC
jgi:hypothetical protein